MSRTWMSCTQRFLAITALLIGSAAVASAQAPLAAPSLVALAPAAGEIPVDLKIGVLNVIPDDALGFFLLSDFDKNRDTVEAVLHKLKIPFDTTREYADFNDFLERLEGWDSKGAHAFAALPGKPNPLPVFFIPVTDYKKFAASLGAEVTDGSPTKVEQFGKTSLIAEKANYAVIVEGASGEEFLKKVVASKKSVAAACEPIRTWLGKQQFAGVAMSASVQMACDEMLKALEEAKKEIARETEKGEESAKYMPLAEMARTAGVQLVTAAREDLTHLTVGVRLDEKSGIAANGQAVFKPNGKFAAIVKSEAALPADCLKNLPGEQFIMSAAYAYPKSIAEPVYKLMVDALDEVSKIEDAPFDAAKLKEAMEFSWKLVDQLQYISQTQSVVGTGMYDGVYGIYHVTDAEAFLKHNHEGMKKLLAALDKFKDKLGGVQISEKKIGDIEAKTVSIDMLELMKAFGAPQAPQQDIMMKAMFGGDGKMTIYLAAAAKDKVVMSYSETGLKTLVESVKADKAGLADDVMIKKTAAMLPSGVLAVGYVDIGGYIEMVKKMMNAAFAAQGAGAFPIPIPPFPNSPPIGYTMKMRDNTASLNMVVPMDLMENIRDYVIQMQGLIGAFAR